VVVVSPLDLVISTIENPEINDNPLQDNFMETTPAADRPRHSNQIFRVRVTLRMKRGTRMHAHHAAILYALLSEAHGRAQQSDPCIPDGLLLDAPEQARLWLAEGSSYAFGFTLFDSHPLAASQQVDALVRGLRRIGRDGGPAKSRAAALGNNFEVQRVDDLVSGRARSAGGLLEPIPADWIEHECEQLAGQTRLTLRFLSPLRAHRSKHARQTGHQFFDRFHFDADAFLRRIAGRLDALGLAAGLDDASPLPPPVVVDNRLVWLDLSYGPRETRKALGGGVGRVEIDGVSPAVARCLVWGQYARIGEATRFGFGHYRIEQLGPDRTHCARAIELLDLVADDPALDAAAGRAELASGEASAAAEELKTGDYHPQPHFRVFIPKADGEQRMLSIPSRLDRVLQRSVLDTIGPAVDLFLEESSLAYRRGLGRHTAAKRLSDAYAADYRWAIRADFQDFFDSIDHRQLRERLEAYLADDRLAAVLMDWIQAGAPSPGRGVPTGAPLSPLLANLFLDEFDEAIEKTGCRLVRYADDFVILFRDRAEADRHLGEARRAAEALRLELNRDRTQTVELRAGFDFLGFHFAVRDDWEFDGPEGPQPIDQLGAAVSRLACRAAFPRRGGRPPEPTPR
jgi:CRISPR-associated protein Cas1